MTETGANIAVLRNEILDQYQEWRTLDRLSRRIKFALAKDRSSDIRWAWKDLQAYQQGVDSESIDIPLAESVEAEQERVERFTEEIAEAEDEINEERDTLYESVVLKCREMLDALCDDDATKKEQVITLKETVESDLAGNIVAEAVECSTNYAGHFRWDEEEQAVVTREGVKARRKHRFSDAQKARIRHRDGEQCVKCGSKEPLEVHHIIPVEDGGKGNDENGATLCKPCHDGLRRWPNGFGHDYETIAGFWEWANSGEEQSTIPDYIDT